MSKRCQKMKASSLQVLRAGSRISEDIQGTQAWKDAALVQVTMDDGTLDVPVFWNPAVCVTCRVSSTSPMVSVPLSAITYLSRCSRGDCIWLWQRDEAGSGRTRRWKTVGHGALYTPSAADEGCFLRVGCTPPSLAGTVFSNVSNAVSAPPFDDWRWRSFSAPPSGDIRIATYNVLADAFASTKQAKKEVFHYCTAAVLAPGPRRQRIYRDLLKIDADIFGLQEVDTGQLAVLKPMEELGWERSYLKKGGASLDGCALFWRSSRFRCEDQLQWSLSGKLPGLKESELQIMAEHPTQRLLNKMTSVAQAVLLRDLQNGRLLLVANTHLYYHPKGNHIRLLQLYSLLKVLAETVTKHESEQGEAVSLVVLGDLNARKGNFGPRDQGQPPQAAYRMIRDGFINSDDTDWRHSLWSQEDEADTTHSTPDVNGGYSRSLTCPAENLGVEALRMDLKLPWPLIDPNDHLEVTNFTADFQECLDYTLLDARCLKATRTFEAPPLECLRRHTALPSDDFPSDHLPVVVEITYLEKMVVDR
ncbi:unnamed protein product [Durusdinium trenchii]|uniref:Endonuclease/exonuclease/phosphatase domain-containing protein n=1 Tax=Durusdinium trenchii TaxID=1381693 RepID=A0ABP0RYC8_9DINO